jgi:hypothetical protein
MDQLTKRKAIARAIIEEVYALYPKDGQWEPMLIVDDEHGQYLLYTDGWRYPRRFYGCVVHLEVRPDGKVYLRHDGTDLVIADWLTERGIPESEIVLAFQSPQRRKLSGFALE